ncbi:MAG: ribonuclease PH [Bordetella sp.]|nr:MAG: ribonuclease PH [Bordetella sp.]
MFNFKDVKEQRLDGRVYSELRPFELHRNFSSHAEGSVLVKLGETCVLCTASISNKKPSFVRDNEGWITAQYSMLPGSVHNRIEREVIIGKQTGRTQEIQRLIGRSLRSAINLKSLCGFSLSIDCDVLKADGGTRCASITGSWVAAVDAINVLIKRGNIKENPIKNAIASISIGILNNQIILDMDYHEDSQCEVDMNVVMNDNGNIVELQGTGERSNFSRKDLQKMLDIAENGIKYLICEQKKALKI